MEESRVRSLRLPAELWEKIERRVAERGTNINAWARKVFEAQFERVKLPEHDPLHLESRKPLDAHGVQMEPGKTKVGHLEISRSVSDHMPWPSSMSDARCKCHGLTRKEIRET